MSVARFVGGTWASVHGPAEPRALLRWVLDRGFLGLLPAPSPRARDWAALRPALRELPARITAIRVESILTAERRRDAPLASVNAGERALALQQIAEAAQLAAELGVRRLLLEPGIARVPGEGSGDLADPAHPFTREQAKAQLARRNAVLTNALDASCRGLFEALRRHPELTFCLTGSRNLFGLGEPQALEAIFEDLGDPRLCYWHEAAVAAAREHLLGVPQGDWLERFRGRLAGVSVGDYAEGVLHLPPGAGAVDYPLLGAYRRRSETAFPVVLELDPSVPPSELPGMHAFLDKFGL